MSKRETMQNSIYGLMCFGALSEEYWKAYNEYQNYLKNLKEMYNRFVYRDTDAIYVKDGDDSDE